MAAQEGRVPGPDALPSFSELRAAVGFPEYYAEAARYAAPRPAPAAAAGGAGGGAPAVRRLAPKCREGVCISRGRGVQDL